MTRAFLCLLSMFLFGGPVCAWNKAGHMVTGAIAYQVLKHDDEKTIAKVVALLKKHPDFPRWDKRMQDLQGEERDLFLFMQAARWADDARDNPVFYPPDRRLDRIHYVNLPYKPAGQPAHVKTAPPDDISIFRGYEEFLNQANTADKPADRAVALCWVFHLIGDVHQPLHTTSLFTTQFQEENGKLTGDRGGTRFYIRAKKDSEPISLHKFWDDLILGSDGFQDVRNKAIALRLRKEFAKEKLTELAVVEFQQWAVKESLPLAKEVVYREGKLEGSPKKTDALPLPDDYTRTVQPIAERRAVLAGYRLAAVLRKAME
jgi:S1/P1 Nuclease